MGLVRAAAVQLSPVLYSREAGGGARSHRAPGREGQEHAAAGAGLIPHKEARWSEEHD